MLAREGVDARSDEGEQIDESPDGRLPSRCWRAPATFASVVCGGLVLALFLAPEHDSAYGTVPSPLPLTLHGGFAGTQTGVVTGGTGKYCDARGQFSVEFLSPTETNATFFFLDR